MKKIILSALLMIALSGSLLAQDAKPDTGKQFMQITTIESVVSGGTGRSKMIITEANGTQKEEDMNNLFSITGINFRNIKENELQIMKTLKSYTDTGWKIEQVIPLPLSPGTNGTGIFMTRYFLSKAEDKK